jgi:hypothetical protein
MKTMTFFLIFIFANSIFAAPSSENSPKLTVLNSTTKSTDTYLHKYLANIQTNELDTLSLHFDFPGDSIWWYDNHEYQLAYEATRLVPLRRCLLKYMVIRFVNANTLQPNNKNINLFVFEDLANKPGTEKSHHESINVMVGPYTILDFVQDLSSEQLIFKEPFWICHQELTIGYPTSVFDYLPTPEGNYYKLKDGYPWLEEKEGDYVQFAIVEYLNQPPDKPVLTSPINNAKYQGTTLTLQWSCSDQDNDPLTYNVYLDSANPPTAKFGPATSADTAKLNGLQNDKKYFWQVVASDGKDSTKSDIHSFSTKPASFSSLQHSIVGGNEEKSFVMISVPGLLDNDSPSILEQTFGSYDNTKWRFFQDNNNDLEYPNTGDLEPGRAFWLISKETKTITFGSGTYITRLEDFSLPIVNGWNQIGNPFAQAIDWQDIKAANTGANIQGPYFFNAGYDSLRTNFEPFGGCYIYVENLDSLKIPPPKNLAKENVQKISPFEDANWYIQILAQCGGAQDNINYLGMCELSEDGFDRLDYREPPIIGEYVSVYFDQDNWQQNSARYTTDFRKQNSNGARWNLKATSCKDAETIKLTFANIESLPSGWKAELVDISNGTKITLAPGVSYELVNHKDIIRDFAILVGSVEFISNEQIEIASIPAGFQLFQNYPNPFNSSTTIAYDLPNEARVKIDIFDIYGRLVDTLFDGNVKAGHHTIVWNATKFSSGIYLLRLAANTDSDFLKLIYVK